MSETAGAFAGWVLVAVVLLARRHRSHGHRGRRSDGLPVLPGLGPPGWLSRRTAIALVIGVTAATTLFPVAFATAPASAGGFDCKDAPAAQLGDPWGDFVDSDAKAAARGDGTDYGRYGWAGLKFATYDLGCGPDVTRAPGAVFDTSAGNLGLNASKAMAGAAIWLDRQSRTQYEAGGSASGVLAKFDELVQSGGAALKAAFYDDWIVVAILILGIVVLVAAFRGSGSSVMRASLVGAAALFLAALAIGAPRAATRAVDEQFTGLVGNVQDAAMRQIGVDPKLGPRSVVINDIITRQWRTGWFGNPDSPIAVNNAAQLRGSLALTYDEQDKLQRIMNDPKTNSVFTPGTFGRYVAAYNQVYGPKKKDFEAVAAKMSKDSANAYDQFIGKNSGRMNAGFLAAVETFTATALWTAASLLKLLGLLIIRLAILFAPIWVPLAVVSEKLLMTIVRFIGSALFWAVAASAAVAAHLIVMVKLFDTSTGDLGNGWRVFMLIVVTAVIWMVLRPFKRLTQFAGMNINATARGALGSSRRLGALAAGGIGALGGAGAATLANHGRRRSDEGVPVGDTDRPVPVAQEGRTRRARVAPALAGAADFEPVTVARPALTVADVGTSQAALSAGRDRGTTSPRSAPSIAITRPGVRGPAVAAAGALPPGTQTRPGQRDVDANDKLSTTPPEGRPRSGPASATDIDVLATATPGYSVSVIPVNPYDRDGEIVYDLYTPSTGRFTRPATADLRAPVLVGA